MRYSYTTAWAVGNFSLPDGPQSIVLHESKDDRFTLTAAPDSLLEKIDRGNAVARCMLQALFGGFPPATDSRTAYALMLEKIKEERRRTFGAVLVATVGGDIQVTLSDPPVEFGGFGIVMDKIDKEPIVARHKTMLECMKLAVSLQGIELSEFSELASGVYFTDENGCDIYSINSKATAHPTVSRRLRPDAQQKIASDFDAIVERPELTSITRLVCQMKDRKNDRFRSFLFGWNAMEILVHKTFDRIESNLFDPLAIQGKGASEFVSRVRQVMRDKYRLADKMSAITAGLFPKMTAEEQMAEIARFKEIKSVRDRILHGEPIDEESLPIPALSMLLQRFLTAYLEHPR